MPLILAMVGSVGGWLGYKLGRDIPNPATVPTANKITPFEVGILLVLGFMGLSVIKLLRDLLRG